MLLKRLGQLLAQFVGLLLVIFLDLSSSWRLFLGRRQFLASRSFLRDETFTSMTMP